MDQTQNDHLKSFPIFYMLVSFHLGILTAIYYLYFLGIIMKQVQNAEEISNIAFGFKPTDIPAFASESISFDAKSL